MEKFKNTMQEILASLGASPQLKVLSEAKVRTPERDSIPLLFMNMILQILFFHNITDREYNPPNVIFIAKSGIGKSRLLATLRYLDFVYYCEDITPKHLKDFLEKVRDGKKRLLVIPDFNSIISAHGQKTQHTTLSILRELMSDGITNLAAYGMEFESKFAVKAGVITAMTIDNYSKFRETWKTTGFLNRFIPYSFKHSQFTEEQILHSIFYKDEVRFINAKPYNIIRHPPKDIEMNPQLVETLSDIAKDLAEICQATPYRDAIRLTDLLQAFLIIQGVPKLTIEHVNQFRKLIKYVNYDFNEV
jgi:hypothetical protein